jgi:hypothetical protein
MTPKAATFLCFLGVALIFFWVMTRHAGRRVAELRGDYFPEPVTTKRNRTFPKELIQAARRVALDIGAGDLVPPLQVGEECQLIGHVGPIMTVVEASEEIIIAAWDDGYQEHNFDRCILVRPLEPVRPAKVSTP